VTKKTDDPRRIYVLELDDEANDRGEVPYI